ncbi:hypothetical protein [Peptacetobacter sp. AB845]|uniref:hypothetical protein n=1 Tax=Peptacetobacter sp. AB845 TaxID=3388429 RepID=UPI0039C9A2FB
MEIKTQKMNLFSQKDINEIIRDINYKLQDKGATPDYLSQESFLRAERELEENERDINDLYLLYSQKLELTEKNKENLPKERYNYMISEYKYLTNKFEKLKSSLEEIKDLITNTVLDTSEEGFKFGFLAHKELNKTLNI